MIQSLLKAQGKNMLCRVGLGTERFVSVPFSMIARGKEIFFKRTLTLNYDWKLRRSVFVFDVTATLSCNLTTFYVRYWFLIIYIKFCVQMGWKNWLRSTFVLIQYQEKFFSKEDCESKNRIKLILFRSRGGDANQPCFLVGQIYLSRCSTTLFSLLQISHGTFTILWCNIKHETFFSHIH